MKKRWLAVMNIFVFALLVLLNSVFILQRRIIFEDWCCIGLAAFFFFMYFLGVLFPDKTAKVIWKFGAKVFKNSSVVDVPVECEFKRVFIKRTRKYLLVTAKFFLFFSMLSMLTR